MKSLIASLLLALATLTTGCYGEDPNSNCDPDDAPRCRNNTPSYCGNSEGISPAGKNTWEGASCGSWVCDDSGDEPVCVPPPPAPMDVEITAEGCTHLTVVAAPVEGDTSVPLDIPPAELVPQTLTELPVDTDGRHVLETTAALLFDLGAQYMEMSPALWVKPESPTYDDASLRDDPTGLFIVRLNAHVSFRADAATGSVDVALLDARFCPEGGDVRRMLTLLSPSTPGSVNQLTITTLVDGEAVATATLDDFVVR